MGAEHKMTRRIQLRRDTGANWTSVDPVLSAGEIGVDLTTGQIKIGDGSSTWSELSYYTGSDVDLTEYATKEYVDDAVGAIVIPDVSEFITAADIPTDFKGSVFADDSTLLVDGVNASIPYSVLSGAPTIPADISDLTDTENLLGSGSADTGDITFDGVKVIGAGTASGDGNGYSTLELVPDNDLYTNEQYLVVDPTTSNHIHIRAGGAQDASNAELYLGGEKNYVRVTDGNGVRLYNESSFNDTEYYLDGAQFTSATWTAGAEGQPSTVSFTSTDQNFTDIILNSFFNDDRNVLQIITTEGTFTLTSTGFGSIGEGLWRFNVNEIPAPTPQTVSEIILTIWTTRENSLSLSNNDFTVNVTDDVRITGRDTFSLRNTSTNEPITIRTDYDGDDHVWKFGADGNLTLPGSEDGTPVIDFFSGATGNHQVRLSNDWTVNIEARADGTNEGHLNLIAGQNTRVNINGAGSTVEIVTGDGESSNTWQFDSNGGLTFPDNTVQSTAWSGTAVNLVSTTTASITTESNPNNGPFIGMVSADLEGDGYVVFGPAGGDPTSSDQLAGVDLTRLVGGTITQTGTEFSSPILSVTSLGNKLYSIQVEGTLATITGGQGVGLTITVDPLTEKIWTFGTDGGLRFPDNTVQTTAYVPEGEISGYKGFKAHYGRLWGDDPTLSKIVIYKDTASPTSTIAADTDDDLFVVSGLGGSDIVALFVIAGSDDTSPVNVSVLKSFAEAVVDTVILVDGEEGNFRSIADMRAAFYDNIETLAAAAGSLYEDFEFYLTEFEVDGSTTVREGSGAEFTINNDGVDTYTVTAITAGGTNYLAGHKILVLGTSLGGESPANDAVITVTGISDGLIDTVSITGTAAAAGLGLFAEVTGTNYEVGSGLVVIQVGNNFFGEDFVNTSNSGSGYVVGDVITVPGDTIQGGTSPANDITITVTSVDGSGAETGFTFAGTFPTEVWPPNFIRDGGDDQYDDGNFIDTNLANEINYNDGEIVTDSETEFGSGSSYVVVYENSIFGVLATGADITSLGTSGETGADGDGSTDTGSLYGDTNISLGNFVFIGDKMTTTGSDLYVQSPDDLFLDALGDDVLVRASDDIRLRAGYNFETNDYDWQFRFTDGGEQIFFNGNEEEDYGRITPNLFDEGVRGLTLEGENQIRLRVDNSGNELILNSDGELIFSDNTIQTTAWAGGRVVAVPGASTGAAGDKAGDLAFDSQYIYYCTADYTDGIENIWKRVAWSNDTWGG
jgi:hypothetical protein